MIAKVIPAKAGTRTFGQLVDYVAAENRLERPRGREFDDLVRYVGRENVVDLSTGEVIAKAVSIETQGVASLRTAAVEMEAVGVQCRRLRAPADYHLVLSWQEGEHPTPDQAFAAGRHALGALGMEAHQYVMAVHGDTANVHLHVAVNRVHPDTYRAVSPFRDYIKLDRAMREIELEQGWAHDRGPTIATEHGVVLAFKEQTHGRGLDGPARISSKAQDLGAWSGDRPFTEWVQEAAPALKATLARPGVELGDVQRTLATFGLELRAKGSGLVVVHHEDPSLVAKASQIARFMSREKLEQQIGRLADRVPAFKAPERAVERMEPARAGPSRSITDERDEDLQRRWRVAETERLSDQQRQEKSGDPRRDYKREPERRAQGRDERRQARERLYGDFREAQVRTDAGRTRWEHQRTAERARYAAITATKTAYRRELRETGLAPQIAISLAAFRAAQERADLRDVIARERAALKRELHGQQRQAWREFVTERALAGDEAAISALRGLRYRDRRREIDDERVCGFRGQGDQEPRVLPDLRDVAARVERNGDVSYRWKVDTREAFRDQGQRIAFTDTSDASIGAGLDLARAKWGETVELTGSQEYKERALRLAVTRGMRVSNVELQELQRQVIEELERAREPVRLDVVRVLDRDPYGPESDGLTVERWNAQTKQWALEDYPPIAGDVERGQVHVIQVFGDGRRDVDDDRTKKLRVDMARERERTQVRERGVDVDVDRGGMSR
jgi:hypothetical protein